MHLWIWYGYIHGYPRKICGYGYGYGWEISYPRQPWRFGTYVMWTAYFAICVSLPCYLTVYWKQHVKQEYIVGLGYHWK